MNNIFILQKQTEELSIKICSFCKPLMLSNIDKEKVHRLLKSEIDLRLAIESTLEAKTEKDLLEKLSFAREESEIILYTLMQFDEEKIDEISPIKKITEEILNTIKQIK